MTRALKIFYLLTAILFTISFNSIGQHNQENTFCHLHVTISPARNLIDGTAEIISPAEELAFYLDKNLLIRRITSAGSKVSFKKTTTANLYEITGKIRKDKGIIIEFSGRIIPDSFPRVISSLNMINPELTELSDHIIWYPRLKGINACIYALDIDVPREFNTVTNLSLMKQQVFDNHKISRWESGIPVYGITMISAPGLKSSSTEENGRKLEIFYTRLPQAYIDSMKKDLQRCSKILTSLYGPSSQGQVRVIYSPRSAGGYARAPLIVVSEKFALDQRHLQYGYARDFRLNAHEISHYWSMADVNTPDDWLNEGFAEYSALLVSEEIIGRKFSDLLLNEYKEIISQSHTTDAIAETYGDSPDREINRYYKPVLLLNDLRQKYGEESFKGFLKSVYKSFTQSQKATTGIFLNEIERSFGRIERDSISLILYRKGSVTQLKSEALYSLSDSTLAGKWTGPLTQFGATVKFVLNLEFKRGILNATLDSPDQNVTGIPLSDLRITADSLSFKIGVAAAAYRGQLNRDSSVIHGEFIQRGGTYPLVIQRDR